MDSIVALLGLLFYSTRIPVCQWFLSKGHSKGHHWDRRGETAFIDARKLGHMTGRALRNLSAKDIACIANTCHAWRAAERAKDYADVSGFCKSAPLEDIRRRGYVLPLATASAWKLRRMMVRLSRRRWPASLARWREQQAGTTLLDAAITANLVRPGFGNNEPILEGI